MAATVREPTTLTAGSDQSTGTEQPTPRGVIMHLWEGLDGDDTGRPVMASDFADKTVQIWAASHGGGTTVLQGSNDPRANPNHADHASAVWKTLSDSDGNAISVTSDSGVLLVRENPLWIRPSQSGGTAASTKVALVCRK